MNKIDRLLHSYERQVVLPLVYSLAGSQKIWFAVYDKHDERRIRSRIGDFELASKHAGKGWLELDLTNVFPEWMAGQEYRESYFESPEDLDMVLPEFLDYAANRVKALLEDHRADKDTIVALYGVSSMFGFIRISELVNRIHSHIRGRLLVFFPGEYENNTYRLLDARDGWSYLAVPILYKWRNQN